jgi:hypothetical protein
MTDSPVATSTLAARVDADDARLDRHRALDGQRVQHLEVALRVDGQRAGARGHLRRRSGESAGPT